MMIITLVRTVMILIIKTIKILIMVIKITFAIKIMKNNSITEE